MYLLLLVFGAVLGAAGVVLALSGVSLRDGTFDAAILTPGIVAAVGGLLLIGLGLGLRTLQRIEQALTVRPMPRALPLSETMPAELADASREAPPIPFAPKASRQPLPGITPLELGEDAEKSPDNVPALGKMSPALPTIVVSPADKANAAGDMLHLAKGSNGAGARLSVSQPQVGARSTITPKRERTPALDALSPKGPRPIRPPPSTPAQTTATEPAIESQKSAAQASDPASPSLDEGTITGVSVLKSGLVNGMAYTLYSDGSIEAQLPEGTLRFGSITELRNHIEQAPKANLPGL
jgi:hypothetical protein